MCCRLQVAPSGESYGVTAGLAESNGSLLPGLWHDSLHVTCRLTACTPGSAPGPTLGNEYGKTLPFYIVCTMQCMRQDLYRPNGLTHQSTAAAMCGWFAAGLGHMQQISIDSCWRRVLAID